MKSLIAPVVGSSSTWASHPTCECRVVKPGLGAPQQHGVELNLIKRGLVTYLFGGNQIRVGAGRLAVFWAAIPHQTVGASSGAEAYVLTLPLSWFLQFRLPEDFTRRLLSGQVLVESEAGTLGDYEMFDRWIADLQTTQPGNERSLLLEAEARLLRFANGLSEPRIGDLATVKIATPRDPNSTDRILQMMAFIAQNYADPINVDLIGKSAGLNPNYAMSLFRKMLGTTLVNYVTRYRVAHAQHLLATTESKVVDVALRSGFNSLSRFNDAFKRECGFSPREYRQRSCTNFGCSKNVGPETKSVTKEVT